jgi:hypothetical protein
MILMVEPLVKFIAYTYIISAIIFIVCINIPEYDEYKSLQILANMIIVIMQLILVCSIILIVIILIYMASIYIM